MLDIHSAGITLISSKSIGKKYVRASHSGRLGLCAKGPNVIIYPQKIWFSEVSPEHVPLVMEKLEQILGEINVASQRK